MVRRLGTRSTPPGVAALMAGFDRPWWLVGGWSIEAFTGVPREHEDIDLSILACDVPALRAHVGDRLAPWSNDGGTLRPLSDRFPEPSARREPDLGAPRRRLAVGDRPAASRRTRRSVDQQAAARPRAPLDEVTWVPTTGSVPPPRDRAALQGRPAAARTSATSRSRCRCWRRTAGWLRDASRRPSIRTARGSTRLRAGCAGRDASPSSAWVSRSDLNRAPTGSLTTPAVDRRAVRTSLLLAGATMPSPPPRPVPRPRRPSPTAGPRPPAARRASHHDVRRYSRARRNLLPRAEHVTAVAGGWATRSSAQRGDGRAVLWCPGSGRTPRSRRPRPPWPASRRAVRISERTLARVHPASTAPALLSVVRLPRWPSSRLQTAATGWSWSPTGSSTPATSAR